MTEWEVTQLSKTRPKLNQPILIEGLPGIGNVGKIAVEKAESKYIEVAAASILARAAGLEQLNYLSKKAGFTVPKGSTHVKDALQKMVDQKLKMNEFVKLHFGNVRGVITQ